MKCVKKFFFHSDHLISPSLLFTSVHERVSMKCGVHIARVPSVCVCVRVCACAQSIYDERTLQSR